MREWKTRLAVSFTSNGTTYLISPIDSFSPTFALNAEPMHSIEQSNMGVTYGNGSMTWSCSVKSVGDVAAQLTALALQGTLFDIILQENDGDDWSFHSIVMSNCVITSASPSNATISGAPTATFSGFALAAKTEGKAASTTATVP
jgi:hypothetical protein